MNVEEARQQAQDENTAPEILARLAKSQNKEVRQCVAKNPNASVEVLKQLVD